MNPKIVLSLLGGAAAGASLPVAGAVGRKLLSAAGFEKQYSKEELQERIDKDPATRQALQMVMRRGSGAPATELQAYEQDSGFDAQVGTGKPSLGCFDGTQLASDGETVSTSDLLAQQRIPSSYT